MMTYESKKFFELAEIGASWCVRVVGDGFGLFKSVKESLVCELAASGFPSLVRFLEGEFHVRAPSRNVCRCRQETGSRGRL